MLVVWVLFLCLVQSQEVSRLMVRSCVCYILSSGFGCSSDVTHSIIHHDFMVERNDFIAIGPQHPPRPPGSTRAAWSGTF